MRKYLIPTAALAALALAAVEVAPTIAQSSSPTTFSATATVSPNKAGTKAKPKGVKLTFNAKWVTTGDVEHPIIQSGDVNIPKGGLYNGGKFPSCSAATLGRGGPSKCPAHSIMGKGSGDALADTVHTTPKITVVNGGKGVIYFWTVLQNPARVAAAVPAKITKDTSGKWSYKVHFEVPQSLQIVAGVPITLNTLRITVGGEKYAKDYIATTSCPSNRKWAYSAVANLSTGGSVSYNGTTPCK